MSAIRVSWSSFYVVLPSYEDLVSRFAGTLEAGELPIIFWLLIIGAKDQPLADPA